MFLGVDSVTFLEKYNFCCLIMTKCVKMGRKAVFQLVDNKYKFKQINICQ